MGSDIGTPLGKLFGGLELRQGCRWLMLGDAGLEASDHSHRHGHGEGEAAGGIHGF